MEALLSGQIDVGPLETTDARLSSAPVVLVEDDRAPQPHESVVPMGRTAVAGRARVERVIERLLYLSGMPDLLSLYRSLERRPLGKRLFSLAVCWKAPYFRTVRPVFVELGPGRGEVRARNRRAVHNHLGPFHAIACCNLAELVAGTITDVSLPATHRRIPKG